MWQLPQKAEVLMPALQCFPYIARRLLTDNNPRTRAALRQLLYAVRAHVELMTVYLGASKQIGNKE